MLQAFARLRVIHRLFDEAEFWLINQLGTPTCVPNCGLCCEHNTVTCHSIEASLMISFMVGQAHTEYVDAARSWLIDKDPMVSIYEGIPTGVITGKLREEWNYLTSRPCIFLNNEASCVLHRARPFVCRAYGVTKLPGLYCPRPLGKGENQQGKMLVPVEARNVIKAEVDSFLAYIKERNPDWLKQGFLPAMIFRQARESEFRDLIADNKIASAKLVGIDYSVQALWQEEAIENFIKTT